ncbi:hypothetical protein ACFVXG_30335 [Kitasatospora sp. NPDC058162]|uniref:hypothetical protein n=1 Tax=Kitasatospora sp. NPDC058162 TaxID=3346362 RepID=UPI0036DE7071
MTAAHVSSVLRPLPVRLAQAGAWLWATAPFYLLVMRPRHANHLPPHEQWGAAEEETSELNTLAAGFIAFLVLGIAAAAVLLWVGTAVHLRQGSRKASPLVVVTALGTASVALIGADQVFHGLLDARALGILVPLLSVTAAAPVVALRASKLQHLPAAGRR